MGISELHSSTLDSLVPSSYEHETELRPPPHHPDCWLWAIIGGATAFVLRLSYVVATYLNSSRVNPPPAPTSSPTTVAVSSPEWSSIVRVTILDGSSDARDGDITCFHPLVLPDDIIPISDAVEAGKQVAEAIDNGSALDWRRAPLKDRQILDVMGFEIPIEIEAVRSAHILIILSHVRRRFLVA